MTRYDDWELAHLVALSGLPHIGPNRLAALIEGRSPSDAWAAVGRGVAHELPGVATSFAGFRRAKLGDTITDWRRRVAAIDPEAILARHRAAGIAVLAGDDPELPRGLQGRDGVPPVVYVRGNPRAADGPTVGIVGTRRATEDGRAIAEEFGGHLAALGVCVVSGLAYGIDGAAHRGALAAAEVAVEREGDPAAETPAAPAAVVAGGPDQVYPASNAELWAEVAAAGMVLAEAPLGTEAARWRFAARNRLVAMLSDVLVVVETPEAGGSMYTVEAAMDLDVPILAVPGSILSRASAGTNWLINQGSAEMCTGADDIVSVLQAVRPDAPIRSPGQGSLDLDLGRDALAGVSVDARRVHDLLTQGAWWIDDLVESSSLAPRTVVAALQALEARGLVQQARGRWQRRVVPAGQGATC